MVRDGDAKGGATTKFDKKLRIPIEKIKGREDAEDDTVTENSNGADGIADFGMDIEDARPFGTSAPSKGAKGKRECKTQPHSARKHHHLQQQHQYNQQLN